MDKTDFSIEYWRGRAEEARTIAERTRDPQSKGQMLRVAEGYENMADRYARAASQRVNHA